MPFSLGEKRTLDCQYGTKYYKSKPHSSDRVFLQGTRKKGCQAHIQILEFCIYPQYGVKNFLPHVQQKYNHKVNMLEYCQSMDVSGVWGTEIEILAVATLLQAPIYTYTSTGKPGSYRWVRYSPLSHPNQVVCDYVACIHKLVHLHKSPDYHLELFHFDSCHYDLIVPEDPSCSHPSLSNYVCTIVCE